MADIVETTAPLLEEVAGEELPNPVPTIIGIVSFLVVAFFAGASV
jgi:hypothetical protein